MNDLLDKFAEIMVVQQLDDEVSLKAIGSQMTTPASFVLEHFGQVETLPVQKVPINDP